MDEARETRNIVTHEYPIVNDETIEAELVGPTSTIDAGYSGAGERFRQKPVELPE